MAATKLSEHFANRLFQAAAAASPEAPTMVLDTGGYVYDCFFAHVLLAAGMGLPTVLTDYALFPHRPVELRYEDFDEQVLAWRKPKLGDVRRRRRESKAKSGSSDRNGWFGNIFA